MLTAVFDIGKTNKKFLLFAEDMSVVSSMSVQFDEIADDDGDPCEDVLALTAWILDTLGEHATRGNVGRINFSAYGATLVHLDDEARVVGPAYNYLKGYPERVLQRFMDSHGPRGQFETETASPVWGMLNSGLQLFWLKHEKPDYYSRIRTSLHLPQYCSYVVSGREHDEATSVGCHTGMWNFAQRGRHGWLDREGVASLLPPMASSTECISASVGARPVGCGTGVHDSSASLYPYLCSYPSPFVLVSTGTWVVTMNPFSEDPVTRNDLSAGALCYLTPDQQPVKSVRQFLGQEYDHQCRRIADSFGVPRERLDGMKPDPADLCRARSGGIHFVASYNLISGELGRDVWNPADFPAASVAYHALVDGIVKLVLASIRLAAGATEARRIFVEGGFARNELFVRLLASELHPVPVLTTELAQASAFGAALLVNVGAERAPTREQVRACLNPHAVAPLPARSVPQA